MEQFLHADLKTHEGVLRQLNEAYMRWVLGGIQDRWQITSHEIVGMSVEDYVALTLPKVVAGHPPDAVFYLVQQDREVVGMGGLRQIDERTAEIKRIFVLPTARGVGLGERIFARLIADARDFGYQRLRLDTGPFMQSAHRIYEAHGFVDISPYAEAEVPERFHHGWRFMEKQLD